MTEELVELFGAGANTSDVRPAASPAAALRHAELVALAGALRDAGYRFTTVTPLTHARVNARPGNEWANSLQDVFGWSRPFRESALPAALFDSMRRAGVAERSGEGWHGTVRFSTLDGELFAHSAFPTSGADSVFFGPDTYRFVAAIRDEIGARKSANATARRAVDIGCGAGPGAIALARAFSDAEVFAADINPLALEFTRVNAAVANLPNVVARQSDLLAGVAGEFDWIVANPPYLVDRAERAYRHGGGPLGARLSLAMLDAAIARLAPGGTFVLYTGAAIVGGADPFLAEAQRRLAGAPIDWTYREVDPDVFGEELLDPPYSDTDRIAAVVLSGTRRLTIEAATPVAGSAKTRKPISND